MLAEAALDLGVPTQILLKDSEESARGLKGVQYFSLETLKDFAENTDVLCFESEFFSTALLQEILKANSSIAERPSQKTLTLLRDKLEQKKVFSQLGLSQAPFKELDSSVKDLRSLMGFCKKHFPEGCVLKRALGGYDGKGNYFLSKEKMRAFGDSDQDYVTEELRRLLSFVESSHTEGSRLYLESWIEFDRELAVVAYPRTDGVELFPLVESFQEKGVCREVWGPYDQEASLISVQRCVEKIAKAYPDLGVFALECFERQGQILINEMAPRVHNSAHYSRLYPYQSQFHAHIATLMDLPFKRAFQSVNTFVMRNILGPENWNCRLPEDAAHVFEDVFEGLGDVVWYRKSHVQGLRKMGHVSVQVESREELESMKAHLKRLEEDFWKRIEIQIQESLKEYKKEKT
jgi:5-(carboxyamino)imidazole ribonucleotide synthase